MKEKINVMDYATTILNTLKTGVLITTKSNQKINVMTISWGTLGIEWGKPIFTFFIRENRYTRSLLDESNEFTISIPFSHSNKTILNYCGTHSGRDYNKIKELGLILEKPDKISVPCIKQFPLTLECKVIYKQKQEINTIHLTDKQKYYPQNIDGFFHGSNRDAHIIYCGEIVSAYLLK